MDDISVRIEPAILYLGTPVVLISSIDEHGTCNLAPMSSAWWLGWRCILGLGASSKTPQNILATRECVLNLPSIREVGAVDRLARLTGSNPVPDYKQAMGYAHEGDKFGAAGLTAIPSETVRAPRVAECPIQLEAVMVTHHDMMSDDPLLRGFCAIFEMRITRVHAHPDILMTGDADRIDPDKWRPLMMSFQKFYGLAPGQAHPSRLAEIAEDMYRSPDIERARAA